MNRRLLVILTAFWAWSANTPASCQAAEIGAAAHVPFLSHALGYTGSDPAALARVTDVPNVPYVLDGIRDAATQDVLSKEDRQKRAASDLLLGMFVRHADLQKNHDELEGALGSAAASDIERHASNIAKNAKRFPGLLASMRRQTGGTEFDVTQAASRLRRLFDGASVESDEAPVWTGEPPSKRLLAKAGAARGKTSIRIEEKNKTAVSWNERWVALAQDGMLFVFDRATGSPVEAGRIPVRRLGLVAFDPASSRLALYDSGDVAVRKLGSALDTQWRWKTPRAGYESPLTMQFSADGSRLAIAVETDHDSDTRGGSGGRYDIYVLDATTGTPEYRIGNVGFRISSLAFGPSGNSLIINDRVQAMLMP